MLHMKRKLMMAAAGVLADGVSCIRRQPQTH